MMKISRNSSKVVVAGRNFLTLLKGFIVIVNLLLENGVYYFMFCCNKLLNRDIYLTQSGSC